MNDFQTDFRRLRDRIRSGFRVSKPGPSKPAPPKPTRYATVYGESLAYQFQEDPYKGKSGLTPRETEFNQPILSPLSIAKDSVFRKYQQNQLLFTTQQLFDVGAIVKEEYQARSNNLENELFQGFRRDRWKSIGTHPMGDGTGRNWTMSHEDVYQTCLPSLRLASRMLTYSQNNDWFDALCAGPRKPIPHERIPSKHKGRSHPRSRRRFDAHLMNLISFHRRHPEVRHRHPFDLSTLAQKLVLEIQGSDENTDAREFWGMTYIDIPKKNALTLRLNPRILWPLFRLPLSTNERLVQQFFVAVTLVHEYAHAISFAIDRPLVDVPNKHPQTHHEPYFEDEPISEVGWSAENALFGGGIREFPQYDPRDYPPNPKFTLGGALMALATRTWPYFGDFSLDENGETKYGNVPILAERREWLDMDPFAETHPLTLKYMEDIQQEAFWRVYIDKYSGNGLRIFPKLFVWEERWKARDEDFYDTEMMITDWDVWEQWVEEERPDPVEFARELGFRDYNSIRVPEALRNSDRLDRRDRENRLASQAEDRMRTEETDRQVEEYTTELNKKIDEYDQKRRKVYKKDEMMRWLRLKGKRKNEKARRRKKRWERTRRRALGEYESSDENGEAHDSDVEHLNDILDEACHKRKERSITEEERMVWS